MNKIVLFTKNFSSEYINYIVSKIPYKFIIELNKRDYFVNFFFDRNTLGFIHGSKYDEELEKIRFNWTFKNEPFCMDVDDLRDFLSKI